ncbi:hypothetical protein [Aquimarina hainanensis]
MKSSVFLGNRDRKKASRSIDYLRGINVAIDAFSNSQQISIDQYLL